jgi:hypothetical protein
MKSRSNPIDRLALDSLQQQTRRHFLQGCPLGLAAMWLASQNERSMANDYASPTIDMSRPMAKRKPHFAAKAKRVIYLHMAGSPSQLELFDYKPALASLDGKDCPASFLEGKQFAFIQGVPKMLGSLACCSTASAWLGTDRLVPPKE